MPSIDQLRTRIGARVRQTLGSDELGLNPAQREQVAAAVIDGVLLAVHDIVGEVAREQMPESADALPPPSSGDETVLWEGRPFLSLVEHYQITSERIRITRGLLSKDREDIELIRVQDIEHSQHLTERMLSIGDITLHTADPDTPDVVLRNVNDPVELHELLRRAVLEARQRHRMVYRENL